MTSPRMRSDITQIAGLPRLELHVLWTTYQGERLSIKCYVMLLKTLFALVFSLERGLDGFQIVDVIFRRSSSALRGTQNPSIVACLVQFKRRSVLSLGSTDGDGWCAQGGRGTTVGPSAHSIRMEIWASQKIRLADLGETGGQKFVAALSSVHEDHTHLCGYQLWRKRKPWFREFMQQMATYQQRSCKRNTFS